MSRIRKSTRGLVLTVVVVGVLSACTPPLPPDVLAAKAEESITCQTGTQDVSLPEDFTGSMELINAALTGLCPDQSLVEVAADAPAAVKIVDHVPTTAELTTFNEACPSGAIVVPAFGYGVTLSYNIIGLEGLVLTPQVVAGMLNGTITSWEDPLISAANPDYDFTGLPPITILTAELPQGAVEAMTAWLSIEAPTYWTAGATGTLAAGTTFPTMTDLLGELTVTEGAVAVLPAFVAINNGLPMASADVQGEIIGPDDSQLLKIGLGATVVSKDEAGNITATPALGGVPDPGNIDLAASKIVLAEGQPLLGWPIMGIAHVMVCDDPANPGALSAAQFLERLAGQGSLETFGVTPLPEPIRVQTFAPLKVVIAQP